MEQEPDPLEDKYQPPIEGAFIWVVTLIPGIPLVFLGSWILEISVIIGALFGALGALFMASGLLLTIYLISVPVLRYSWDYYRWKRS